MAKNKKKRPADTRLKVIPGGGAPKAVLPGKGPPSKRPPEGGSASVAASNKSEASARFRPATKPANLGRDARATSEDEASAAEDLRLSQPAKKAGIPRNYLYAGLAAVALVVVYILMTRSSSTPSKQDVGVAAPSTTSATSATTSAAMSAATSAATSATAAPTMTMTATVTAASVSAAAPSVVPSAIPSATTNPPSATTSAAPAPKPAPKPATPPPAPVDDYQ